jgi:hypothetical protein
MSSDDTPTQREVGAISPEQVAGMLKAATDYLKSQNLFVNIAIAVVEANGYYTVGNMPDSMMETVFRLYLARKALTPEPDVQIVDTDTGRLHATH